MVFMLKKIALQFTVFMFFTNVYATENPNFFSITEQCQLEEPYSVILCLNGKGPVSCQTYTAHASRLLIKTTAPHQSYSYAGIKILSSLYTLSNCSQFENGYCLFQVDDITPAVIELGALLNLHFVC